MRPIIVDANNWCYIQYHAFGENLSVDDQQTGVMWGFFNQLLRVAEKFESDWFVFAWDSRKSHRRRKFPEYKAHREDTRSSDDLDDVQRDVFGQFDLLRKTLLPEFGFQNIYLQPGLEADDIIASLVDNDAWTNGHMPVVVSTDKDLYQLLSKCDIFRPITKDVVTLDSFEAEYGIGPKDWVAVKAMAGDKSDNIPGIEGVGEKTAIKFIKGELGKKTKTYEKITSEEGRAVIERNKELMALPYPDTPVFTPRDDDQFDIDAFLAICNRYRFQSFMKMEALAVWRERFRM